ncbi:NmrA family protein [Penicillium lagena]|uniref:NmrA family protein n=1 Tax=Penicillium lagena TaxID=94218 RepID=UPI00254167B7|nr:NmrA family protein [Penicillium lagena]KAJ5612595.1 NmrA family protein [Penicillium lagena]
MTHDSALPKIVTVFGATGSQGGSVVRSLVQNKAFKVTAITRKPYSKAAQELRNLGVEVVQADGWKREEITAAFAGSWAAFVNTNSEDPQFLDKNGPNELDLGKTIIDGIVEANTVKHLVYSSAVSTSAFTGGKVHANAAEMKSKIEKYAMDTGFFETVCPVFAGFYMELFASKEMAPVFGGFPYFSDEEGFLTLSTPRWGTETDMPVGWIAVKEDFGDIVHGVLLAPEKYHKKIVPALSDPSSFPEVARTFQSVTGKKTRYVIQPSWETFGGGIPELEDQRRLFHFGHLSNAKYFANEPTTAAVSAHLKAKAFEAMEKDPREAKLLSLKEWFQNTMHVGK